MYNMVKGTLFHFGTLKHFESHYLNMPFVTSNSCSSWTDCFDIYWDRYNVNESFYFAFPACPKWITEFVDEFNSNFENIKIKIVGNRPLWLIEKKSIFDATVISHKKEKPDEFLMEVCTPAFTIEYNIDYPRSVRKFTSYIVHHCLRMFSYPQGFLKVEQEDPGKDYLDLLCKINNVRLGGNYTRNLSDDVITKDKLICLDNIEYAKKFDELYLPTKWIKQTAIIRNFNHIKDNKFEPTKPTPQRRIYVPPRFRSGDYVKAYENSNGVYAYTNTEMILGKVLYTENSSGEIRIVIVKHINPSQVGREYTVSSGYFYRVYKNGRIARPRIDGT